MYPWPIGNFAADRTPGTTATGRYSRQKAGRNSARPRAPDADAFADDGAARDRLVEARKVHWITSKKIRPWIAPEPDLYGGGVHPPAAISLIIVTTAAVNLLPVVVEGQQRRPS